MRSTIHVFLSPEFIPADFQAPEAIWMVTDVIRASTTICAALAAGAPFVQCCETPAEALKFRASGFCIAGEQNRLPFAGAEIGNSPQHFTPQSIGNRPVALCTTNGTRTLLAAAKHSENVIVGGFCNTPKLETHLNSQTTTPIVVLASGWKGAPNLEDTLFAGWVVQWLKNTHLPGNDSALLAYAAYKSAQKSPFRFLRHSTSTSDLLRLGFKPDVRLCLRPNPEYSIPIFTGNHTLIADTGSKSAI